MGCSHVNEIEHYEDRECDWPTDDTVGGPECGFAGEVLVSYCNCGTFWECPDCGHEHYGDN